MIPFLSFESIARQTKVEALRVFETFWDSHHYVLGNMTAEFEQAYARFCNTPHCIGISNGLDALHIALKALGIGPGDEVIVPSNAYIAALLAVSQAGAVPVLAEPDPHTFNLDVDQLPKALSSRTRCVMPVHLYGQACDMEAISRFAADHGLSVVEDNAQSQGAGCKGIPTGSWGNLNATSFYPTKNLGAMGEAGALTTHSEELAEKVRILRNYGSKIRYHNELQGGNWRIDELQAGLLTMKLQYLQAWNAQRCQMARWYFDALSDIPDLDLPVTAYGCSHVYHLFVIQTSRRDALQQFLTQNGVGTLIHYPIPPHLQEAYRGHLSYREGDFPIAEQLAKRCLSLPLYIGLQEAEITYICQQIRRFFHA